MQLLKNPFLASLILQYENIKVPLEGRDSNELGIKMHEYALNRRSNLELPPPLIYICRLYNMMHMNFAVLSSLTQVLYTDLHIKFQKVDTSKFVSIKRHNHNFYC